jgi:hypothetical protein
MSGNRIGFWRWTITCGIAEFLGIALAALWWVLVDRLEPEPDRLAMQLFMLALKGCSGIIEGAILGYAQATVLRRGYPALSRRGWTAATMILAFIGWVLGSAPSIFTAVNGGTSVSIEPSITQVMLFAALFGLAVGAAFGGAQWLVLRRAARRAYLWVPANMVAWMVALPVIYAAASHGSGVPGVLEVAVRGSAGGLAAGLLLGAIMYPFFCRMPALRRTHL